jgi:ketosteroid isomerase-like protein
MRGCLLNRTGPTLIAAAALVLLAACSGDAAGGADRAPAERAARPLLEADRAFAAASAERGAGAWADAWAADGLMVRDDGRLLRGPTAVREAMAPLLRRFRASFRWQPTEAAVLWPDSLGYTIGRWSIETDTGGPGPTGDYLTAWVRRGGAWKVALDAPLAACAAAPGAHAFDFWLGTWDVAQRIRAGDAYERYAATDRVTPTGHGCVVAEDWRGTVRFPWAGMQEPTALHGASLRIFDPGSGAWTIFWIDDLSGRFGRPFIGRFEGRTGDFFQDAATEGAPTRRIRFRDDGGTVDWELAVRTAPENWTPIWTMRFTPRLAARDE